MIAEYSIVHTSHWLFKHFLVGRHHTYCSACYRSYVTSYVAEDVCRLNTQREIAWLTVYGICNFDAYGPIALHGNTNQHFCPQRRSSSLPYRRYQQSER